MCIAGSIFEYEDEEEYQEQKYKKFYNRNSENWDYYSGLPSTLTYSNEEV